MTTRQFFGTALMAVGGLIALLCGLCSALALPFVSNSLLSVISKLLGEWLPGGDDLFIAKAFLLWGLMPFLAGAALYILGRRLRGPLPPKNDDTP